MAESAAASVARANGDEPAAGKGFAAAAGLYERSGQPYWVQRSLTLAAVS
jgi:hypothetical protein